MTSIAVFLRRGALVISVALLGMLACSALAQTDPEPDSWEKTTSQWFEPVASGQSLTVDNPYGRIYARFGGYEGQLEILATFQRMADHPVELEVRRTPTEHGLEIVVVDAAASQEKAKGSGEDGVGPRDRVELVLFVPLGVTLDAHTEEDRIEVKGIKSDLIASSVKGDIRIRKVEGRVRAKTDRGAISAHLEAGVTDQSQELTTETGEIEVHLWEDANAQVEIATSGEISTDFSLQIEHRRFEEPGKYATATVGEGGPKLTLRSKRGPVRLLRLPRHFRRE